jgi:putative chitinase
MKLSENFSLDEFTFSETATRNGIKNVPSPEIIENLKTVAKQLESIRNTLGERPIRISSGYRCLALNSLIGSSPSSAHVSGYAVDFTCPLYGTPLEVAKKLLVAGYKFDQIINEGNWVHISFDPRMRGDVLTARFVGGKANYTKGIK